MLWIVRLLEKHGALTLKEINEYWCADEDLSYGMPIERRTFYNYKNAIADLLKIVIECDQRDENRYKIVARDDDELSSWLIKSSTVNEILSSNADMRSRILLKVANYQRDYLRTLPLHASQREIEELEDYSIFELHVALTIELTMQILYYGSRVEVLEPAELREEIEEEAYRLDSLYLR